MPGMTRFTSLFTAATLAGAGALALASSWTVPAAAQEWPQGDITVIVAYPAGGGTDSAIRAMTEILSRELGQNILVQNVGGAGGGVAATQVISRDADGYTLLATNSTSITLAPLVERTAYDIDDFEHIAILGEFQNAVFANKDVPFDTLDELVERIKEENRPMTYASQLAIDRLLMQYIAKERGIDLLPLPVSGGNGAVQAVLSGDVDVSFSGGSWAPLVNAGDAKALFAGSHGRLKVAPDLISMGDMGFPFGVTSHISLHAPAGTPEEVLEKISAAFEPAVNGERAQNVGETRFMDMTFRGLDEAREVIRNERETYQAILETLEQGEKSE